MGLTAKPANQCAVCGYQAASVTDHAVHATTAHPELNRRARSERRAAGLPSSVAPRPVSCWRCASLIPTQDGNTTCPSCGWEHPGFTGGEAAASTATGLQRPAVESAPPVHFDLDHRGRPR